MKERTGLLLRVTSRRPREDVDEDDGVGGDGEVAR